MTAEQRPKEATGDVLAFLEQVAASGVHPSAYAVILEREHPELGREAVERVIRYWMGLQ